MRRPPLKKYKKILLIILISITACIILPLATALIFYPAEYVYRVLVWQESDAFDWQKFPSRDLKASPQPYILNSQPDPRIPDLFSELAEVENWDSFLESTGTQSFVIVQNETIVFEKYYNGTQRDSIVTSFSVAKSFTSALIGIAISEGFIESIDDPVTRYLPELALRDPRFGQITIRDLLRMSSGLEYRAFRPFLLNGDDPLTTYFPDQRQIALENTRIKGGPGEIFSYNKYHPQLLGMILERSTGMSVTAYLQTRIWDPAGMEYGGSWSLDSKKSGFEKMETGVNAHAMDFARFGVLFSHDGAMGGKQIIPGEWIKESTGPFIPQDYENYYNSWIKAMPGKGYYSLMWWGMARGNSSYDFCAEGDKGQYIYVCPEKDLVIVRNGVQFGIPSEKWLSLFYLFSRNY